jgi:hypothetical protein
MYVNRARVTEIVEAPNLIKKLVSGKHAVVIGREEIKKLELLGGDIYALAIELELILLLADLDIFELDHFIVIGIVMGVATAKHCLDARKELAHIKRLNYEVICAKLETNDLIYYLTLCGDHNDGLVGKLTKLGANVLTVLAGEHNIEEHEIGLVFLKNVNCLITVGGCAYLISFLFKRGLQQVANITVVIDYENFGIHFFLLCLFLDLP